MRSVVFAVRRKALDLRRVVSQRDVEARCAMGARPKRQPGKRKSPNVGNFRPSSCQARVEGRHPQATRLSRTAGVGGRPVRLTGGWVQWRASRSASRG